MDPDDDEDDSGSADPSSQVAGAHTSCNSHPGAILCEDFSEPLSGWREPDSDGEWSVVTTHAYSGEEALRLQSPGPGDAQRFLKPLPVPATEVHARAYVWLEGEPSSHASPFWAFTDDYVAVSYLSSDGRVILDLDGVPQRESVVGYPLRQWLCVQTSLVLSGSRSASVTIDGVPIFELNDADMGASLPTNIEQVGFGLLGAQQAGNEMFVDDFVVGTAPIPCEG